MVGEEVVLVQLVLLLVVVQLVLRRIHANNCVLLLNMNPLMVRRLHGLLPMVVVEGQGARQQVRLIGVALSIDLLTLLKLLIMVMLLIMNIGIN